MPTYKNTGTSWAAASSWTAGTGPSLGGIVDSQAGSGSSLTFTYSTGLLSLSSLKIDTTAASTIIASSPPGGQTTNLSGTGELANGHALYVSANKTLEITLALAFSSNITYSVFVDSGAVLRANALATLAGQNTIQKRGSGTWLTSTNEFGGTGTNSNVGAWELYAGVLQTGSSTVPAALGTATVGFYGGTLQVRVSRTFTNTITVNTGGGTITADSGATATMSNAAGGGGVLTIAGSGNVAWNNNISCSLNVETTLSMGSNYNIGGASTTLSGAGTISMNGTTGTISSNAPTFTGDVNGNFNYSGTNNTFGGRVTGTVKVEPNSSVTFSRTTTHSGVLEDVKNGSTVTVRGTFAGGTSITYTDVWYTATLIMEGPNANVSGAGNPNISLWDKGTLWLIGGATVSPLLDLTYDGGGGANAGSPTIGTNDTNINIYSGTLSCRGSPARGSVKLLAKTDGVLVLSGTAVDNGANTRPFAINGDSGYAGTVRLTGGGFNTPSAPVNHLSGKLHINRADAVTLGAGLTVSSDATLSCSSNGAYAAQMVGAVTLNSGAIMQFGAP